MKHIFSFLRCGNVVALFILMSIGLEADAQAPAWQTVAAISSAGASSSVVEATASDGNGNIYLAGHFVGTASFGSTVLTSAGGQDLFVAKWSTSSRSFVWAQRAGGAQEDFAVALAVSGTSVYIAGSFMGTAIFGPGTFTSVGTADAFVAKLTDAGSTGSFIWTQHLRGDSMPPSGNAIRNSVISLAVQGSAVYVAGYFEAEMRFGPTLTLYGNGNATFVARLTDAGLTSTFGWVLPARGPVQAVAVVGTSVYIAGSFSQSATFGPFTLSVNAPNSPNAYIAKLVDSGTTASFVWAQQMGGPGGDGAYALATNGNGVYVAGYFRQTISFGSTTLTGAGSTDAFVAKFTDSAAPGTFIWAQRAGGPSFDGAFALTASGNAVYVAGYFSQTAQFGNTALIANGTPYEDAYVAKLVDAGGSSSFAWAQRAGGPTADAALAVATTGSAVYVGGYITPIASFGSQTISGPIGSNIGFLAPLNDATGLTTTSEYFAGAVNVFPNPAHGRTTVQLPAIAGTATLTLLDALGRPLRIHKVAAANSKTDLDLTGLAPGLYAVRVAAGSSSATRRLVVE